MPPAIRRDGRAEALPDHERRSWHIRAPPRLVSFRRAWRSLSGWLPINGLNRDPHMPVLFETLPLPLGSLPLHDGKLIIENDSSKNACHGKYCGKCDHQNFCVGHGASHRRLPEKRIARSFFSSSCASFVIVCAPDSERAIFRSRRRTGRAGLRGLRRRSARGRRLIRCASRNHPEARETAERWRGWRRISRRVTA